MAKPRDIIAFIQTLTLTGGDCDGKPFRVLPWERKFIGLAFGAKAGDSAYLSCARANGKTAVVAAIATCVIDPGRPASRAPPRRDRGVRLVPVGAHYL